MVRDPESYAVQSPLWEPTTPAYRHTHEAMGGEVRITILDKPAAVAHDAAQEAFEEIDRIEGELSRFEPGSDVWLISRLEPGTVLTVGLCTLECLQVAADMYAETGGLFDVTVGALRECYRDEESNSLEPTHEQIARALVRTGMGKLVVDAEDVTVAVRTPGLRVDLGGIGKGYAVDEAAKLLREWEIDAALISAGGSSYYALGRPPGRDGWRLGLDNVGPLAGEAPHVHVADRSMSGSAVLPDRLLIIHPRTGQLLRGHRATWASAPTAAVADALSTTFLLMEIPDIKAYCDAHEDVGAMVAVLDEEPPRLLQFGRWD